jgi:intein-encoded DNA endonuclease-like protein
MKYNNELKNIDTQEKAYLLGFLYGDGTICTYLSLNKRKYTTKLSIQENDKDLIYSLHNNFPFFNVREFDYSKYNKNSCKQVSISKTSKELYDDLLLNGLYPRKSYENKDKIFLPNIDNNLTQHFIRGFFDADGSVYRRAKRKNLITIEFCSVSFDFLNEIDFYLKTKGIN